MLMRSEGNDAVVDCDDPMTVIACTTDTDACPAACRESEGDDTPSVVKSGDLEVSFNPNKGADAFLYGGVSDLDTISFRASEEGINVTKVTLERYGYSSSDDVAYVWLEDEDGTRITDPKELNSKDQVTLSILKGYRELSTNDTMTIVLQTVAEYDQGSNAGSSIGFKVISVDSSAAEVEGVNPKGNPYLYDLVSYNGSDVTLTYKGKNDVYHIWEGPYEVFRFKLKAAPTSAALVRGFTITNIAESDKLDLEEFVNDVTVTVNDEKAKNVTWSIDEDELTVNFDEVEVEAKATAIFAMNIDLSDDFDEMESKVLFTLEESTDIKVTEKKTWARVGVQGYTPAATAEYSFNGSKITLSNNKLGTVNMPAGSEDVVIADWTIDLGGQAIVIAADTIAVKADKAGIEAMRLIVDGDEFDAKCDDNNVCTFNKKMTIEKDGKLQLVVDIDDDAEPDTTIAFTVNDTTKGLLGKTTIGTTEAGYVKGFTYEESKDKVLASDFVGSVTIYNLKVTAAKASLENNLTKAVEFKTDKTTSDVVVFDGTYTAKKQDLTLTDVYYTPNTALADADDSVTLKLYVDGKLVASTDIAKSDGTDAINDSLTRVKVAAGESVKVEVKADVYAAAEGTYSYKVELRGEDADGNEAGKGSDDTIDMKFVAQGSADVEAISNSNYKQKDVLLRTSNIPLAAFRVSASNGTVDLDKLVFTVESGLAREAQDAVVATWADAACTVDGTVDATITNSEDCTAANKDAVPESETSPVAEDAIRVKIGGENVDEDNISYSNGVFTITEIGEDDIDKNGIEVVVYLKGTPAAAPYTLTLDSVNDDDKWLVFNKYVVPALLTIEQTDLNGSTQFKFTVDKYESSNTVSNVCFKKAGATLGCLNGNVSNGSTFEIEWENSVVLVDEITYDVAWLEGGVDILKATYNDYFKVWSTYLKVFKAD